MSVKMNEGAAEASDELIDLNKEPTERKRKRVDKGNEVSGAVPEVTGRVLRSRTMAMTDGEKHVIKMEMVKVEGTGGGDVPVSRKGKMKGRRGRPPKSLVKIGPSLPGVRKKDDKAMTDGENKVIKRETVTIKDGDESKGFVLRKGSKKKGRRGRPPKIEGKSGVSSLGFKKKDDKAKGRKNVDKSNNGVGQEMQQVKRKRGRPPKMENGNLGLVIKNKKVKKEANHKKKETNRKKAKKDGGVERLNGGRSDFSDGIRKQKKIKESAEADELGLREQKQLVRDQIVAMLMKAGWTIEYRQRQSKDYQDAVYVDRSGRTHWSVTLAYKKLKNKIDEGKAEDIDISAFSPIPEETLGMLFRVTQKGAKAGKKKGAGKTKGSTKTVSSKGKSSEKRIKARVNRGKRRTLLARRPTDGSGDGGYVLYEGKRSLLSWMIDVGTVPVGGKVRYKRGKNRKIMLEGKITRDGICCDCCNVMHTIRDFETHAKSELGKPYQNIYMDSGNSLLQCLESSWRKHQENDNIKFVHVDVDGDDPNDDTCNVCGDGGDLICCDSCPSTFHHNCLGIKVPSGDWHCVYCSCKFCGMAGGSTVVTDDDDELTLSELFTCCLCEEKFHVHCFEGKSSEDFDYENPSFCGKECLQISERLEVLLGVRHELAGGFSYTLLQRHDLTSGTSLSFNPKEIESNCKLAVAFAVMDECFEPITDERSGSNMIRNVVYNCGSNIKRLDYGGFYTIVLEKGDELVAAASIRIHGNQLAEMPFIGTRYAFRRQGMCSRLLNAIETVLSSLGVEKLVIPAISELNETWTKIFGFAPLEESKRQEMAHMSMIVFPGVDMLQKPVPENQGQKEAAGKDHAGVTTAHKKNVKEILTAESNASSDIKIINLDESPVVESGKNSFDGTQQDHNTDNRDSEAEAQKEAGANVPVLPLNGESEHENSLDRLKDNNNPSLEQNTTADCKPEEQLSANNGSLNGFLSVNGNGKCDPCGGGGEEEEKKLGSKECQISKEQAAF